MKTTMRTVLPVMVVIIQAVCAHAQPDTITANPKAVAFRQIWAIYGQHENDRVGSGIGGIPDINGDGINEFAVLDESAGFKIYFGSKEPLTTTPAMVLDVYGPHPIVGDFWGTGHPAVGGVITDIVKFNGKFLPTQSIHLYRTETNTIDTTTRFILDAQTTQSLVTILDAVGADLDGDGADELVVLMFDVRRADSLYNSELWIYRGGKDFRLNTPTVIVPVNGRSKSLNVGHWDNDQYVDIAVAANDGNRRLVKFWFGGPESPWDWTTPDRSVLLDVLVPLDCDGDGALDVAAPFPNGRVGVFLSGAGKSVHTRSFAINDVDMTYYRNGFHNPVRLGYLSDSLKRYEMLGIVGGDDTGSVSLLGLNGGPNGPNHTYDAYDASNPFDLSYLSYPLEDVTGDGWNEFMVADAARNSDAGFATILSGGPYIPRDSLTTGVVDVAIAGRRDAVSLWPLPARDELHIAWRGDLSRMPARFMVHDVLGRLVAQGEVDSWRGEAIWRCADRPVGVYLVSMFDARGVLLATAKIQKEGNV